VTLRRRQVLTSVSIALAATLVISWAVGFLQARDRRTTLERIAASFSSDSMRAECESDPNWFLAGPRSGRPTAVERSQPDAELRLPRPSAEPLPLEFFAYDDEFIGSSTAAPRFPNEFRTAMRATPPARTVVAGFPTPEGEGLQIAQLTGWRQGPCAVLLVRMRPAPRQAATRAVIFGGLFLICFAVAMVALGPTVSRVRRLAAAVRESVRQDFTTMPEVAGRDEISAVGAAFNEAVAGIRQRGVDIRDRAEALRRFVAYATDDVAAPLDDLTARLAAVDRDGQLPGAAQHDLRQAIRHAHAIVARLRNLAAVTELRARLDTPATDQVDLIALVERVIAHLEPLARASSVTVGKSTPATPVTWAGSERLLERAVSNLVDNAIRYNRPGGRVRVELNAYEHGRRFSLKVTDDGPGVGDEEFAGLTAIGRFRGDEGRSGRGGRGLGLAITREVADRLGLKLDLRRPAAGGFEAELGGTE
jgi:signal transduction histidine kinase